MIFQINNKIFKNKKKLKKIKGIKNNYNYNYFYWYLSLKNFGIIKQKQLNIINLFIKNKIKTNYKYFFNIILNTIITKKNVNTRMGSGKGKIIKDFILNLLSNFILFKIFNKFYYFIYIIKYISQYIKFKLSKLKFYILYKVK